MDVVGPAEVIAAAALIVAAAAARYARRSAASAERSEAHAAASAEAATESAQADTRLAQIAEAEQRERLQPELLLDTTRTHSGYGGRHEYAVENRGPHHWDRVIVSLGTDDHVQQPFTVNGSQEPLVLTDIKVGARRAIVLEAIDRKWDGFIRLVFQVSMNGYEEEILIQRQVHVYAADMEF